MIRVTVELIPKGIGEPRMLGIATISNDGKRSQAMEGRRGSYSVRLSKWTPKQNETWKRGRVDDFDRKKRGPWDLLYLALKACVGDRNNGDLVPNRKKLLLLADWLDAEQAKGRWGGVDGLRDVQKDLRRWAGGRGLEADDPRI